MQFATLFPVHNPGKRAHPQNEIHLTQKDTNFRNAMFLCYLRPEKRQKSYPERHEFWQRHVSSLPEAREMPKILPRKTRILERHVSSLPEARETPKILPRKTRILAMPCFFATLSQRIAKSNCKRHEFHTKLHSLTPAKMPRKVFSFPEFRTSFILKCTH